MFLVPCALPLLLSCSCAVVLNTGDPLCGGVVALYFPAMPPPPDLRSRITLNMLLNGGGELAKSQSQPQLQLQRPTSVLVEGNEEEEEEDGEAAAEAAQAAAGSISSPPREASPDRGMHMPV